MSHVNPVRRRIVVGVSGASGAPYARRLLERLCEPELREGIDLSIVLSSTAEEVWRHECEGTLEQFGVPLFRGRDYNAPFASGSACADAMVVMPASPSFYARPASLEDVLDSVVGRVLDHLGMAHASTRRWGLDIVPNT